MKSRRYHLNLTSGNSTQRLYSISASASKGKYRVPSATITSLYYSFSHLSSIIYLLHSRKFPQLCSDETLRRRSIDQFLHTPDTGKDDKVKTIHSLHWLHELAFSCFDTQYFRHSSMDRSHIKRIFDNYTI